MWILETRILWKWENNFKVRKLNLKSYVIIAWVALCLYTYISVLASIEIKYFAIDHKLGINRWFTRLKSVNKRFKTNSRP